MRGLIGGCSIYKLFLVHNLMWRWWRSFSTDFGKTTEQLLCLMVVVRIICSWMIGVMANFLIIFCWLGRNFWFDSIRVLEIIRKFDRNCRIEAWLTVRGWSVWIRLAAVDNFGVWAQSVHMLCLIHHISLIWCIIYTWRKSWYFFMLFNGASSVVLIC